MNGGLPSSSTSTALGPDVDTSVLDALPDVSYFDCSGAAGVATRAAGVEIVIVNKARVPGEATPDARRDGQCPSSRC